MNDQEIINRFEELEAGRILGDLDAEEVAEWEKLSNHPRCQSDVSLELTAAAVDVAALETSREDLPDDLIGKLQADMAPFVVREDESDKVIRPSLWKRFFSDTETAWAIAAVFIILFIAQFVVEKPTDSVPVQSLSDAGDDLPAVSLNRLMDETDDLIKSEFTGLGNYEEMSGEVVWSDRRQEGYLTLTNLPPNDPTSKQYQLWIVDPDRDTEPVDGGVFDIPADNATAVIPIRNPLVVNKPQLFLITLEKPGGVVVSDREVEVALATATQS